MNRLLNVDLQMKILQTALHGIIGAKRSSKIVSHVGARSRYISSIKSSNVCSQQTLLCGDVRLVCRDWDGFVVTLGKQFLARFLCNEYIPRLYRHVEAETTGWQGPSHSRADRFRAHIGALNESLGLQRGAVMEAACEQARAVVPGLLTRPMVVFYLANGAEEGANFPRTLTPERALEMLCGVKVVCDMDTTMLQGLREYPGYSNGVGWCPWIHLEKPERWTQSGPWMRRRIGGWQYDPVALMMALVVFHGWGNLPGMADLLYDSPLPQERAAPRVPDETDALVAHLRLVLAAKDAGDAPAVDALRPQWAVLSAAFQASRTPTSTGVRNAAGADGAVAAVGTGGVVYEDELRLALEAHGLERIVLVRGGRLELAAFAGSEENHPCGRELLNLLAVAPFAVARGVRHGRSLRPMWHVRLRDSRVTWATIIRRAAELVQIMEGFNAAAARLDPALAELMRNGYYSTAASIEEEYLDAQNVLTAQGNAYRHARVLLRDSARVVQGVPVSDSWLLELTGQAVNTVRLTEMTEYLVHELLCDPESGFHRADLGYSMQY